MGEPLAWREVRRRLHTSALERPSPKRRRRTSPGAGEIRHSLAADLDLHGLVVHARALERRRIGGVELLGREAAEEVEVARNLGLGGDVPVRRASAFASRASVKRGQPQKSADFASRERLGLRAAPTDDPRRSRVGAARTRDDPRRRRDRFRFSTPAPRLKSAPTASVIAKRRFRAPLGVRKFTKMPPASGSGDRTAAIHFLQTAR